MLLLNMTLPRSSIKDEVSCRYPHPVQLRQYPALSIFPMMNVLMMYAPMKMLASKNVIIRHSLFLRFRNIGFWAEMLGLHVADGVVGK